MAKVPAENKNKGGRPTRCTLELAEEIGSRVANGASIQAACGAVGIGSDLLSDWRKRDDEPYKGFTRILKRHLADAVAKAEVKVYGGKAGWQASARWLESIQRDRWCRMERQEINVKGTVDLTMAMRDMSDEELGRLAHATGDEVPQGKQEPTA